MTGWESTTIFGIVSLTFLFFWQGFKIADNHWALKLLTHLLGWAGMILTTVMLQSIIQISEPTATGVLGLLNTTLLVMIFIFFAVFVYWTIYYIVQYYKGQLPYLERDMNKKR